MGREDVERAIRDGVGFLWKNQQPNGSWPGPPGSTELVILALLTAASRRRPTLPAISSVDAARLWPPPSRSATPWPPPPPLPPPGLPQRPPGSTAHCRHDGHNPFPVDLPTAAIELPTPQQRSRRFSERRPPAPAGTQPARPGAQSAALASAPLSDLRPAAGSWWSRSHQSLSTSMASRPAWSSTAGPASDAQGFPLPLGAGQPNLPDQAPALGDPLPLSTQSEGFLTVNSASSGQAARRIHVGCTRHTQGSDDQTRHNSSNLNRWR